MYYKSYNFYCIREGTSDVINNIYEELAFNNYLSGAHWNKMPSCDDHPCVSSTNVTPSSFIAILESEWPIVLNWPYEMCEKSIDMHNLDNGTPLGMDMELCSNISLDNLDYDNSCEDDADNYTLNFQSNSAIPLHHSMHPYIKEISKYESHMSEEMRAYIDQSMNALLGTVVNSVTTQLNKDSEIDNNESKVSIIDDNSQGRFASMYPAHDKRKKDKRLKAYWEV